MDVKTTIKNEKKTKKSGLWALIALACAALVFFACIMIQKNVAEGETEFYNTVWLAAKEVPEGTEITGDNIDSYFKTAEVDTRVIPQGYIPFEVGEIEKLIGMYVDRKYLENDVITLDGFTAYNAREGLTDPVEVSFAVGGVDQIVAGTLREGDKINIFSVRNVDTIDDIFRDQYEVVQLFSDKIVTSSYTGDGGVVGITDETGAKDETPVTMVTIFIERGQESDFFKTLSECSIRVSRVAE